MKRTHRNFNTMKRRMHGMKEDLKSDIRDEWDDWRKDRNGDWQRDSNATSRRRARPPSRSSFYRDKRNGRFLGVCAGIADYTGIGALWVRLGFIAAFLFGMPFVVIGYFIVAFVTDVKPRVFQDEQPKEQEFWRNVRTKPHTTVRDVRLRFKDMERRLRDMERYVTSGTRRLDREINALRD